MAMTPEEFAAQLEKLQGVMPLTANPRWTIPAGAPFDLEAIEASHSDPEAFTVPPLTYADHVKARAAGPACEDCSQLGASCDPMLTDNRKHNFCAQCCETRRMERNWAPPKVQK